MSLTIRSLAFKEFRSYQQLHLENLGNLTIFVGPNAIGKTNIIEGIQLMTSLSSFRHSTMEQLIRCGESHAQIQASVSDGDRLLDLMLSIEPGKRTYRLNGKGKRPADLKGLVPSVVFTPDDLNLVKGSMSIRRAALDLLGSQLSGNHHIIKKDYEKLLRYKNRLLKEEASDLFIESVNENLVTCGAQLCCYRAALFAKLAPLISDHYERIAPGKERLEAFYTPSWENSDDSARKTFALTRDEAREAFSRSLEAHRAEERARRKAVVGPHADSIEFYLGGMPASVFGSQGQQRSVVLAYKIAETSLIEEVLGQKPLLLLDDVMSELDESRRRALVDFISEDTQTFITTTNLSYFEEGIIDRANVLHLPLGVSCETGARRG